jgi:hypothetical protein
VLAKLGSIRWPPGRTKVDAPAVGRRACKVVLLLSAALAAVSACPTVANADSQTFTAISDSHVTSLDLSANYGNSTRLIVQASPVARSYLLFDVRLPAGAMITGASLRLYTGAGSTVIGYQAYGVADTGWDEDTLTFDNAPEFGEQLGTSGGWDTPGYKSVRLPPGYVEEGLNSVGAGTSALSYKTFWSREEGVNPPQLVVDYELLAPVVPANSSPPTISGTPEVGQTLKAEPGGWTGTEPIGYAYQWQRCDAAGETCQDVAGATADSSSPTASDVGATMRVAVTASNAAGSDTASSSPTAAVAESRSGDPVITAAGDIAGDANDGTGTADLIKGINPTGALTLGDNAYEDGSLQQYTDYYDPSWGAFKDKTYPTPGNHDYHTPGGTDYFTYFGARAQAAYYSYNLGSWHLVALNGEIDHSAGSAQEVWLKGDLAANAGKCTLAYWHEPRFTSGDVHGNDSSFAAFWDDLYGARADVVLNGHNHNYERFAAQNPQGQADPSGPREFVAGTGGVSHYGFGTPQPNSEVRNDDTFGVLELTLHPDSYDFRFVPVAGQTFTDAGSGDCHRDASPPDTTPPARPNGLTANAGDGQVELDWADNTDSDLEGYRVYRDGERVAAPDDSSYDDTGLTNGTIHSYEVSAVDKAGNESAKSAPLSATPLAASSGGPYPLRGLYSRETDGGFDRETALGFNLIDSGPDDLSDVDGSSEKAMVWVGSYDRSSCQFEVSDAQLKAWVAAHVGDPRIAVWYLSNEPVFGGDANCPNVYAQHKARADLIHSVDPSAKTLVVIDGNSGRASGLPPYTLDEIPKWKDTTDIVAINAYVCRQGEACEYGWIDKLGQVAESAGLNFWGQIQAFGEPSGQGFEMCTDSACGKPRLPTPDELHQQFQHWRATEMSNYLVFEWRWPDNDSSVWLANHPELQSQLATENAN